VEYDVKAAKALWISFFF